MLFGKIRRDPAVCHITSSSHEWGIHVKCVYTSPSPRDCSPFKNTAGIYVVCLHMHDLWRVVWGVYSGLAYIHTCTRTHISCSNCHGLQAVVLLWRWRLGGLLVPGGGWSWLNSVPVSWYCCKATPSMLLHIQRASSVKILKNPHNSEALESISLFFRKQVKWVMRCPRHP